MISEDYHDTKNHKLFYRFFDFFDCSNQTSIIQLEARYFHSVKCILKQMQCRIWLNKNRQKRQATGFWPLCHKYTHYRISCVLHSRCSTTWNEQVTGIRRKRKNSERQWKTDTETVGSQSWWVGFLKGRYINIRNESHNRACTLLSPVSLLPGRTQLKGGRLILRCETNVEHLCLITCAHCAGVFVNSLFILITLLTNCNNLQKVIIKT